MAEQIKYISENGRVYLEEIKPIVEALHTKLEKLGANGTPYSGTNSGEFVFKGTYEFPRQGAVLFNFKELAERYSSKLPEEFNYNVCVDLLGFKEDTKKYQQIKSSIDDILNIDYFNRK